jgi:lipoic acid synthetase
MRDQRRLPPWLKRPAPGGKTFLETRATLRDLSLHTVCEEARCPNIGECFARHVATFLILGDVCTRDCGFCGIKGGEPVPPDPEEPVRIARAAQELGLKHVVVTSVTRDDLPDGGSSHYCATIDALRGAIPNCRVEILTPDFAGRRELIMAFAGHLPDIWAHNMETVPRLYGEVRPGASYERSLEVPATVHEFFPQVPTKSGLMIGLGETQDEVLGVLRDLRENGVSMCTIGQYLQPSPDHHPVVEYFPPVHFANLAATAYEMGFVSVLAEPFARSSYHAEGRESPRPA